MRLSLRFVIPLLLALGVFAYAVVPLVDRLTLRWFVRDLDIRASLIANTVQDPLEDLIRAGNRTRMQQLFTRITQDERLLVLRLNELGFLADDDPRFVATVRAIGRELKRGDFVFRYLETDDFGTPQNAFLICTFWYVNALAAIGEREEARALFEKMLACRNRHGLLAEHIDPGTREQWGNFVQTYSMVGLISSAIRLSVRWDQAF